MSCGVSASLAIIATILVGQSETGRPIQTKPQHEVQVVNIEIPVRVFDGKRFIEDLGISDFRIIEDGVEQEPLAVYLVKDAALERKDEKAPQNPNTERKFVLLFHIFTFSPRFEEAIDYFVNHVLRSGDSLIVVTSVKAYVLKKDYLNATSRDTISKQLANLVRHDTLIGNSEYRGLLEEMKRMITGGRLDRSGVPEPDLELFGEGSWQEFLSNYRDIRERLERTRFIDPDALLQFAEILKKSNGQKTVLIFYQREYVPMIDRKKYIGLFEDPADMLVEQNFHDLFDVYRRNSGISGERIKRAFSDASISIHFLYLTERPEHIGGLSDAALEEHSEDIFSPFFEMAKATGGIAASSSNPAAMMEKSGTASGNYYLLYYRPTNSASDGKFRNIRVDVKNRDYRVLHRAGYFSK